MTNPLRTIANKHTKTPQTQTVNKQLENNPNLDIHTTNPPNTPNPNNWRTQANCRGQHQKMFPKEHKDITYITEARALCRNCPVQTPCLEYALQYPATDMHGVWAGLTSRQLAAEQRRRQTKPTKPTLAAMRHHNG